MKHSTAVRCDRCGAVEPEPGLLPLAVSTSVAPLSCGLRRSASMQASLQAAQVQLAALERTGPPKARQGE